MKREKVVFFMIVTDRDIVIADRCIHSYSLIQDVPFKLIVYSNWISTGLKDSYFPRWHRLPFLEIKTNDWQTDDKKPTDRRLWGPFEMAYTIWDRELRRIEAPYVATADADFEIIDARFINAMLSQLDSDQTLAAVSSDYSPRRSAIRDSYSNEVISLNEQWHTWFCIYRREALKVPVSHAYYEEAVPGPVKRNAWDDAGYLQRYLKHNCGYRLASLPSTYQGCFVHYGQFSHNKHINEASVSLYRKIQILRKVGLLGRYDLVTRVLATLLDKLFFWHVDRSRYWDGWAQRTTA
jgi:hypothetical protein